ncbi:MAG: sensor histidine kinase, partial [Clostridiales bacterium]|nr:sensor histidine kinase [Clostridiales bacterium]
SSTDGIADGAADRGLSDLPFGAALAERLDGGTGAPFQYQGGAGAVHVSYAPVAGTDWVLVETLPYADLIGGANAIQRRFFYMVTAIAMLSAAGAMAFMGRLVKPIRSMAEAAREIAHGQFDRRLGIRRGDEVGALAASFDAMCDDMERLLKRLSEENELRNRLNLEMLRAQLEPHFLFNALGSIKSMANLSGNPVIAQMVTNLAFMLESALGKNGEFTTLGEELSFTEHYVALQRVRFNDFEFDACVDEEALPCAVPRMILQPLIENSLKHGFLNNPVGGVVRLRARRDGDALRIEIADNGAGMDADRVRELREGGDGAKCVGLSNIRRRLAIYYGDAPRPCGGRYGLSISSQPGRGTAVALSIPFDGKEGATC